MTRWYLDASVALHALLPGGDPRARKWLNDVKAAGEEIYSSTLLHLELSRVLRRENHNPAFANAITDRINQFSIDDGVLAFASAIGPHIKSLDAIHLASACLLAKGITLVTHDATMASVGTTLGLAVFDPIA